MALDSPIIVHSSAPMDLASNQPALLSLSTNQRAPVSSLSNQRTPVSSLSNQLPGRALNGRQTEQLHAVTPDVCPEETFSN